MSPKEILKLAEAHNACDTSSCDSSDAPIERGSKFKTRGFFGYPPYMVLLLLMELCERFSFYGIRSVLAVYFTKQLGYTQAEGTSIYHGYIVACYLTPVLGGIVADQYWGKYKTILLLSIVYAAGNAVVSFASTLATQSGGQAFFTFFGLGLIALGTGGIKPCISSFCGDQLDPNDKEKRERFFNLFYTCINIGAIISSYLTPKLRQDPCMNKDTCYPLAFGVPSVLMFVALVLFIAGTKLYIRNKSRNNVFTQCAKTILGVNPGVSREFRQDSKRVVKICKIIFPILVFWAVFDLAGSVFTYQAGQLDKSLHSSIARKVLFMPSGWLQEDQIEAMNPILLICLIPVYNVVVYPFVNVFFKLTALRKMNIGLGMTVTVCLFAWWLQNRIDANFTYVYPEYNHKSSIKNATFAFQVQYNDVEGHGNDVYNHMQFHNMDYYDTDMFDQNPREGNYIANNMIKQNGQTSPRFWTWFGDKARQQESIVDPINFNSRLADKSVHQKAWAPSLPHVRYTGHRNFKHTQNEPTHFKYGLDLAIDGKHEKFLFPPGKFTKLLVYPNGHLFPVDVPVERPEQGRSYLHFYSRQESVSRPEYFRGRLFCQNLNNYEFQRHETKRWCSYKTSKPTRVLDETYGNVECQEDGGHVGDRVEQPVNIGHPTHRYKLTLHKNATYNHPVYLPEAKYETVPKWSPDMIAGFSNGEYSVTGDEAASKLYKTTFLIPASSQCYFHTSTCPFAKTKAPQSHIFTDHGAAELTKIPIGVNGVYSMVDFTIPEANSTKTGWSKKATEDIMALREPVVWQLLLYFLATSAEILISISGLEYSYAQAPESMKAMVSSLWLLPVTFGNIFVLYISSLYYFKTHAYKIHRFNALVSAVVTIAYVFIARAYVTREEEEKREEKRRRLQLEEDATNADKFLFGKKLG